MSAASPINGANPRASTFRRATGETVVEVRLALDGDGASEIRSGVAFLDHMLEQLARHARIDLTLTCRGDLAIDDHHSVEDCALAIGRTLDQALGERRGLRRFGSALVPLDEALARAAIDLSGRPFACIDLQLQRERLGDLATENATHFFRSLATAGRFALHLDLLRGENDHHKLEAAFKAVAVALRAAVALDGAPEGADVPSTKGTLS